MFSDVVEWVASAPDDALTGRLRVLEGRRREAAAEEAALLAELERRKAYRADEHATMHGLLRSALHWSDRECSERMRVARFVSGHPDLGEALHEAWVSVANAHEIARVAGSVRLADRDDAGLERELAELMRVAERSEYDDLRVHTREWEQRIDRDTADAAAADAHERRNAHVHVGPDGAEIAGEFGLLDGIEIAEIFADYVDAEWRIDRERAVAEHGDDASPAQFARTDAQRRADAVKQVFRDAASTTSGSKARDSVVNVHVDHRSFDELLVEAGLVPERAVDPFDDPTPHVAQRLARTDDGHAVDQATVLRLLLDGYVRMVIRDDDGIPIRWGRTRRLFDGAARDAVRVMSTRCTHPGCRVPVRRCETDHTLDWSSGGLTEPVNGNPRCRRHNNAKNRGVTVRRGRAGRWQTYRPDGTEIQ